MVKNRPVSVGDARDTGSIPGSERSPGVGNGNPLRYSYLENSMDSGAPWAAVCGVAESDTSEHTAHNCHPSLTLQTLSHSGRCRIEDMC